MSRMIVTAADTSHGKSLARLVGQCAELMPDCALVAYDLGLTEDDVANIRKSNPKAEIIKYPYEQTPEFHNVKVDAGAYAWKPMCVYWAEGRNDVNFIFWVDAGCLIKNDMREEYKSGKKHGIYISSTAGTIEQYTHPLALKIMGVSKEEGKQHMRAATLVGFDVSRKDVSNLVRKWAKYALIKDVMNPDGARKHPEVKGDADPRVNHRHDQSVLSALIVMGEVQPIPPMVSRWGWIARKDCDQRPRNIQ